MSDHCSLKADYYCAFCGSRETYPAMLEKDKIIPGMYAKIHYVHLSLATDGGGRVALTGHPDKVLICDRCTDAISESLKALRTELRKNLTNA